MIKKHPKISKVLLYVFIPIIVALFVMISVLGGRNDKESYASADNYSADNYNLSASNYSFGDYFEFNNTVKAGNFPYILYLSFYFNNCTIFLNFDNFSDKCQLALFYIDTNVYQLVDYESSVDTLTLYLPNRGGGHYLLDVRSGSNDMLGVKYSVNGYIYKGDISQFDYAMGYNQGYADGYNDKFGGTALTPQTMFLEPVHQWLNMELFPGFTLAGAFEVVLFVGLALIFIKMFAGG